MFDTANRYTEGMRNDKLLKTFNKFTSLYDLHKAFPTEKSCIKFLEIIRWNGNIISPFDKNSKVYKCKNNRYYCKNTNKYFNVRTKTLFESSNIELRKWFMTIYLITSHKKGISSLQLSKDLHVTQKTAWFMLQRIRKCFEVENNNILNNHVEVDETYIGGKNKNRHKNKKVENSQGRSTKDKTPVLGMIERNGKVNAKVIENVKSDTLTREIIKCVRDSANLYTDEFLGYNGISQFYIHAIVRHKLSQYVDGNAFTNNIEGFWSIVKRGLLGIYHFTSKKHLQKYLDEFVFRFNTREYTETDRFTKLLTNMTVRTRYRDLVAAAA